MNKMTIDHIDLQNQRVLLRVDFNVPLNEQRAITDDTRIVESLPTIRKIISGGGRAIIMSHLGRPKGKVKPEYSLKPVAHRLSELLGSPVRFAEDCIGEGAKRAVASLKNGECLLLENLRFHQEEEANDPGFAKELASFGDVYVNDAFGTAHRAHASTEGVTKYLQPCLAGYLMQKELEYLGRAVGTPARPYTAILGGAKISGKIDVIQNLLKRVDVLLIGGGMMFTFLKAKGLEIGTSLVEEDKIGLAKATLEGEGGTKIILPVDCLVGETFDNATTSKNVNVTEIPKGWMGLDIGPGTVRLFSGEIRKSKTIVWNGPMGVFEMENFAGGTRAIASVLVEATKGGAVSIVGGGDSAAAINQAGLEKAVSHVSTGGGASLELLEGKSLPGIAALTDAK